MASECIYYQWKYGYYCNLANKEIDDDTVHRFCWTYNSDDCPLRKNQRSSGDGCYLTSACIRTKNLSDDCEELRILRSFRDNYLMEREDGRADIALYYLTAPRIVSRIDSTEDAVSVYNRIYEDMVRPCVEMIKAEKYEHAYHHYREYSKMLMLQYGIA